MKNYKTLFYTLLISQTFILGQTSEELYNQGCYFFTQKQFDRALGHFQQALVENPSNVEAASICAYLLIQQGNMDEAIPLYRKVLKEKHDHVHAHIGLSQAYLATGNV